MKRYYHEQDLHHYIVDGFTGKAVTDGKPPHIGVKYFKSKAAAEQHAKELNKEHNNMKLKREDLEKLALETVSAELYYELADTIEEMGDEDLHRIISYGGDYQKELDYQNRMEAEALQERADEARQSQREDGIPC